MKTFIGAVAVAGIMAASGLAMAQTTGGASSAPGGSAATSGTTSTTNAAATQQATGTISKMDRATNTVTMKDGTTYKLSSSADVSKLKEGEQVRIQYQTQGSDRMATAITPASGSAGTSGPAAGGSMSGGSSSGGSMSGTTGAQPKQ